MRQYIESFSFPDDGREFDFLLNIKRKCYDTFYPFKILSKSGLSRLDFSPVTILYGGNGSGKTTALNVIAESLGLNRESVYNRSNFFEDYIGLCTYEVDEAIPEESRIITSDDVFDYMLNIRMLNLGIDSKREDLLDEYLEYKHASFKMKSLDDYEELKKNNLSKSKTQSMYVRKRVMDNVITKSNGESGFMYFTNHIKENALYLLDEPENSLSPDKQMELMSFIEDSVRFFGCQFIISTHSPFLLSMQYCKIYDMDAEPVKVKKWTELENVRRYYNFFKEREEEF